ncbi:MAG TPA: DUF4303 domain-containing protein [Tepidisphaeraceae bacterium]|nr:DUF4303 domain-containing protein [Tepidisphaeraceae bacterium]
MTAKERQVEVDRLKQLFVDAWRQINQADGVYAAGFGTDDSAQFMYPFVLSEKGLGEAVKKYMAKKMDSAEKAAHRLRWSIGTSPHFLELVKAADQFNDRPNVFKLSPKDFAREVHRRLKAACTALQELDAQGLFGKGAEREKITLYIEGGDVDREWKLKWAQRLNPPSVYERYASIGAPKAPVGTFTEFGTKKVYETDQYAQSADKKLIAAATQYHLFLFDTAPRLKQRFAIPLPTREHFAPLGGVAMSADGNVIAAIPFGHGRHSKEFYIIAGCDPSRVKTVALQERSNAIAVSPAGDWIAVTDDSGALNLFDRVGTLQKSLAGHAYWPRGIAVSDDGARLATADSLSVVLWNTADWSKVWTLERPIDGLDFDPSGRLLAGCCRYPGKNAAPKTVSIIDARAGTAVREIAVEGYIIQTARFSPDAKLLACAMRLDREGYAGTNFSALVEIETGKVLDRLEADFEQVRDFAFLPHRNEIAVAVFGHTRRPLVLWKAKGLEIGST